jgi:glycosyltransferase involved in cell wall biosynthesis
MYKHKKNVILIFTSLKSGGGITFVEKISALKEKFNFYLFTLKDKERTVQLSKKLKIKTVSILDIRIWFNPSTLIISNSQLTALLSAIIFPWRHYYVTHGIANGINYLSKIRKILWLIQINFFGTKLIGCGTAEFKNIRKNLIFRNNAFQINNGIAFNSSLRYKYIKTKNLHLCFIGRLSDQKGIDIILDALIKRKDQLKVTIIGDVNYLSSNLLEKIQIIRTKKNIRIFLKSYQKINRKVLSPFNIIIIPSRFEGLPYILLEAIDYCIPIISSDCDGIYEIMNRSSLTFKNQSVDSLNYRINKFIKMPKNDVRKISHSLKNTIRTQYNLTQFLDKYEEIFSKKY